MRLDREREKVCDECRREGLTHGLYKLGDPLGKDTKSLYKVLGVDTKTHSHHGERLG